MKILLIGDVFGNTGINAVKKELPKLKQKYQIDITIANCENVTNCRGLSMFDYQQLKAAGIDYFTMGNQYLLNLLWDLMKVQS